MSFWRRANPRGIFNGRNVCIIVWCNRCDGWAWNRFCNFGFQLLFYFFKLDRRVTLWWIFWIGVIRVHRFFWGGSRWCLWGWNWNSWGRRWRSRRRLICRFYFLLICRLILLRGSIWRGESVWGRLFDCRCRRWIRGLLKRGRRRWCRGVRGGCRGVLLWGRV